MLPRVFKQNSLLFYVFFKSKLNKYYKAELFMLFIIIYFTEIIRIFNEKTEDYSENRKEYAEKYFSALTMVKKKKAKIFFIYIN